MITIDPREAPLTQLHSLLQGVIAPRPIALASTVDLAGHVNLSPFSFFNIFSTHPPILVFSPSRRGRNNTTKHTYENVVAVPEVVINIVNFSMVEQTSLTSVEFPAGVDEFVKSGLTPVPSLRVKPPRVEESPASFECRVNQVIPLGHGGGAGTLVICEILLAHVKDEMLDDLGRVDPQKLDAVARMGNNYYCRAHGESIFSIPKPNDKLSIGFDQIPERVRNSSILTGNDLGRLANIEKLPDVDSVAEFRKNAEVQNALKSGDGAVYRLARKLLQENKLNDAWKVLLAMD